MFVQRNSIKAIVKIMLVFSFIKWFNLYYFIANHQLNIWDHRETTDDEKTDEIVEMDCLLNILFFLTSVIGNECLTTLSDKVCQWLAKVLWFSSRIPDSSINIAEMLLKVALTTPTLTHNSYSKITSLDVGMLSLLVNRFIIHHIFAQIVLHQ